MTKQPAAPLSGHSESDRSELPAMPGGELRATSENDSSYPPQLDPPPPLTRQPGEHENIEDDEAPLLRTRVTLSDNQWEHFVQTMNTPAEPTALMAQAHKQLAARHAAAELVSPAAAQVSAPAWDEAQRISDLPAVDEAIRNLIEDATADNATCLVREVLRAAPVSAAVAAPEARQALLAVKADTVINGMSARIANQASEDGRLNPLDLVERALATPAQAVPQRLPEAPSVRMTRQSYAHSWELWLMVRDANGRLKPLGDTGPIRMPEDWAAALAIPAQQDGEQR